MKVEIEEAENGWILTNHDPIPISSTPEITVHLEWDNVERVLKRLFEIEEQPDE